MRYLNQLTTDGHKPYLNAVENAFGGDVDSAQLVKIYGDPSEGTRWELGRNRSFGSSARSEAAWSVKEKEKEKDNSN